MMPVIQALVGAVAAVAFIYFARLGGASRERLWYSAGLAVAAGIYVAFRIVIPGGEMGIELIGLLLFAGLAVAGFRVGSMVLGLAWLAHAGWDAWYVWSGIDSQAPEWYPMLCIGFDVGLGGHLLFRSRSIQETSIVFLFAGILFGPASSIASAQSHEDTRPNVIFIFTDDHAFQAISAYGGRLAEVAPTPNIDRIANEGMRFDRAYVTNSICAPSRAVVQTGKYSHINGVLDNRQVFDGSQQTFPKLLQANGYETALIGKWHLKTEPTGFDYSDRLPGQGRYYNPDFIQNGDTVRLEGYATDLTTDKALDWLKDRSGDDPFMLMLQHKAPHREWSPPLRLLNSFGDIEIPEPDNLFDDYSGRGTAAHEQDMTIEHSMFWDLDLKLHDHPDTTRWFQGWRARMTPEQLATWDEAYGPENAAFYDAELEGRDLIRWKYQRYIKDYLLTVRAVDENVGRVLDYLDEAGLADNTIVVYTSDQGFYLGEHGWFDKRFMYEESFRTPLLVRWPDKVKPGSTNDDLVSNLDYAQTILEMAGVGQPSDMQGASIVPILKGETPESWRTHLYYHYYEFPGWHSVRKHEGVTDGRHKLIHFYNENEWELYDLASDPNEMKSLYGDPSVAGISTELKTHLTRLRETFNVPPNAPPGADEGPE